MSPPRATQTLCVMQTAGYIHTPENPTLRSPGERATGCLQT